MEEQELEPMAKDMVQIMSLKYFLQGVILSIFVSLSVFLQGWEFDHWLTLINTAMGI